VRNYLHALWSVERIREVSREFDWEETCDTWLCSIAQAEDVLSPYLQEWLNDPQDEALESLAAFILRSSIVMPGGTGTDGFWENCKAQYEELQRWILSAPVHGKLARAAESRGGEFAAALDMLNGKAE